MDRAQLLLAANDALVRRDWLTARDAFLQAQAAGPLVADELKDLGDCVWWLGEFRRAETLYEEAHHRYVEEGSPRDAAMMAFAIAGLSFMRGEEAFASGWAGRGMRLLENQPQGAEHGYVLFMELSGTLESGNLPAAIEQARQLRGLGKTYSDPNLVALGIVSEGKALLKQGSYREGMRLLDEAMLAALSDELAPEWAGNIYCQLMGACHDLGDLQRAREWTQATFRWCNSLSASGPFLGVCRVHRAQLFHAQGAWREAEAEAERVCKELADFDLATVAEAYYQLGEVRRLRGDLTGAEVAYRQSHGSGRDPNPGFALLRLAQGHIEEAHASIQTALAAGPEDVLRRAWLCIACVEISLAAGRVDAARSAYHELRKAADKYDDSMFAIAAAEAEGAVLLSEGKPQDALPLLRSACLRWQQLEVPYQAARVRTLLARAYEALCDTSAAGLELDAAEQVFSSLGAALDLQAIERRRPPGGTSPNGITEREVEVLRLVASGESNRAIAEALTISEKTVARHLTNIYGKLGVSTRTEAARYAFEHGIFLANTKNVVV